MEVSNVVMTGLGRAMSDLDAKDGELSVCHNIINDNGAMRPIWVPEDVMTLHDNEELVYVHRTAEYKNYVVSGRIRVMNLISVYYKYGKEYPENYLRMTVVLQYPAASRLDVTMRFLIAGHEETRTITFPEGTLGKQVLAMGEQDTFLSASFEAQDGYYNYQLREIDDSNDISDNATWDENPPEFLYGLNFFTDEDPVRREIVEIPSADYAVKLTSIGNTLVMTSERGLEYILYKDGVYKPLGQKPPELDVSWSLRGKLDTEGADGEPEYLQLVTLAEKLKEMRDQKLSDANEEVVTDAAAGMTNRFVARHEAEGWFSRTFLVRAAYVMMGQTYMATPPVLMRLNEGMFPLISATLNPDTTPGNNNTNYDGFDKGIMGLRMRAYVARLVMNLGTGVLTKLKDWEDLVTGVEVYVSSPITRYDQNGRMTEVANNLNESESVSVLNMEGWGYTSKVTLKESGYWLKGMQKTDEEYFNLYKDASQFFRVKRFNMDELRYSNLFTEDLTNLESLPQLRGDDFQEHDTYDAEGAFVYNGRVNLYGVKERKYAFPMSALVEQSNGRMEQDVIGEVTGEAYDADEYKVRFLISSAGKTVEVTNTSVSYLSEEPVYLFYPDNEVTHAVVERVRDGVTERVTLPMTSHPTMQGCYWFDNFKALTWAATEERLTATEGVVTEDGKIYTSEVNNPFVFPLGGINTIGTGKVVGVSTVTKALSQGQFGQFPLYVFSTEGVWAMEVAANGLYSSVKPVSRDVCVNGDSITQTDNAVLFVTERGVMLLDGSQVVCISDMMNGRSLDVGSVYGLERLMKDGPDGMTDFMDYAREARMAFDYANSRVVMYHEDRRFCYVFSMTANTWATLGMEIENAVTDYPDVYVQKGRGVKNLSTRADYDAAERMGTLMVTRPVKLGDDGYKTVYELVVRGAMDRSRGAVLLWGSHDGMEYVLIKAVKGNRVYRTGGSGYRYFRIGVVGDMCVGETVSLVSVGFRRKYGNRLR